jgi:hypothetical protein
MPNGKPGDNPLTDVVLHDLPVFSRKIDGLIRNIARIEGTAKLYHRFDWFSLPEHEEFEKQLREILQTLKDSTPP